jgi:putative ABC transport system permease protein
MKLSDIVATSSSNMLRAKARTILTIIAIFIGALTITLTNGIGTGIKSYLNGQINDLGAPNVLIVTLNDTSSSSSNHPAKYTYNPNSTISSAGLGQNQLMMNLKDLALVKSVPNITSAVPAQSPSPDYIMGIHGKYQLSIAQQIGDSTTPMISGKNVSASSTRNQISIPEEYVSSLGYSSNQAVVGKTVTIGDISGEGVQKTVTAVVTGVLQKNVISKTAIYANNALTGKLVTIENEGVPAALANTFQTAYATFPSNLTASQISAMQDQLSNKGFSAKTIKNEQTTIFTAVNAIIIVFDIFGGIALLAASFGIINTLYMSVQERTKEIGLMKALGMGKFKIFLLFSFEAILIGFWGSILGVGCAALIGKGINSIGRNGFLKNFPGLSLLTFPLSTVIVVVVGIMIIAFLAGALPAIRASKKDPIEALRYE